MKDGGHPPELPPISGQFQHFHGHGGDQLRSLCLLCRRVLQVAAGRFEGKKEDKRELKVKNQ